MNRTSGVCDSLRGAGLGDALFFEVYGFMCRVTEVGRNSHLGIILNTLPEHLMSAWHMHVHKHTEAEDRLSK